MDGSLTETAAAPRVLHFTGCTVWVWDDLQALQTHFPDGTYVPAAPKHDDEQRRVAREHGYGDDLWAMVRDHEIGHTLVAEALGHPYSPTFWYVAHPDTPEPDWRMEETLVMGLQRWLQTDWAADDLLRAFPNGRALDLYARALRLLRG